MEIFIEKEKRWDIKAKVEEKNENYHVKGSDTDFLM
jgi:hypothetical protein